MSTLDLGIIGNCCVAALIDPRARVVWMCWPRLDGDPVFNNLLADDADGTGGGLFAIELDGLERSEQRYLPNTAVLLTRLFAADGAVVEVTDFAPRFRQYERNFRPTMIVRHVRPLAGAPRIRVRCRPSFEYGAAAPRVTRGSNHIRYVGPDQTLRLSTDATISYILDETTFRLERPVTLFLGADESFTAPLEQTGRAFFDSTLRYWQDWARALSIPFEWQDAVIRAAVTLKLCTFEETGAVVAALTTSVPEALGTARCWDYRYCWLRDSYFVVHALNRLSATRTMENYLGYILNIAANAPDGALQPLYGLTLGEELVERTVPALRGYRGSGPVRVGNDAYRQVQNDVFGAVVLSATQSFFDRRLARPGDIGLFRQLEVLGRRAVSAFDQPDAGLWELRTRAHVHTFSAVMCWAAADRLARIAGTLGLAGDAASWRGHADAMHRVIAEKGWNAALGAFVGSFGGEDLDASLLLLHDLGFLAADDPRFISTVEAVGRTLKRGSHVYRYANADDFGTPETAFMVCSFWYIQALAAIGRRDEARVLFEDILTHRNPLGLLSEDIDTRTGELWGNFPQTYSMVGLITCAMRLSTSWEEAY
jgi:GH15 family glucan-1,4-alpha-glucosidase